jgi:hypothetical protein
MSFIRDIEEVDETKGNAITAAEDKQNAPSVAGGSSEAQSTSKSTTSTRMVSIDPALLRMISTGEDDFEDQDRRKSQLCCFVFCDLVLAGILMNILYIFFCIFHILVSLWNTPFNISLDIYDFDADDDFVDRTIDRKGIVQLTRTGGGIVFSAIGVVGAWRFSKYLVLASAIYYCIYAVMSLLDDGRWIGAFLTVPFAYTNFHLFIALKNDNISSENYATEKHCCIGGSRNND